MKPNKLNNTSLDGNTINLEALYRIAPSCFTEVKDEKTGALRHVVNFTSLRQLLGDDSVEDASEMYQFTWPGKQDARREAARPINKTLRPVKEDSVDWDNTQNLYIEGDNLEVLKLLQKSYMGKIKMIYIDPPYNTGNDFVYDDDFKVSQDEMDLFSGNIDEQGNRYRKNPDTNARFHSDWCSMIYSRLLVCKTLLTEDGIIFMSIDDNEQRNLRNIADEVFGEKQFIGQITLLCNPKGRSQDKYIAKCHEFLLIYSKGILEKGAISIPKEDKDIEKDYPLQDKAFGPYREIELRNTHREFGKFNRKNLWYPFYVSNNLEISLTPKPNWTEVFPIWEDGFEGCWTWSKEKAKENIKFLTAKRISERIKIYRKSFAFIGDDISLKQVKSIWSEKSFFTEKGQATINSLLNTKEKIFQAPKSVSTLLQCVQMSQDKQMTVLDFFSGSATTAHAVMQLNAEDGGNRKYIMVQLPEETDSESEAFKAGYENICEIGKERIRRAGKKIKEELPLTTQNLDTGFRVFRLDSSNFNEVELAPKEFKQENLDLFMDNVKSDRNDLDLLFGAMLNWGVQLSLPMTSEIVDGKTIYTVNNGDLVACFAEEISDTVIKTMAEKMPLRVLFRDNCFDRDDAKINIFETLKQLCDWSEEDAIKNIKVI